MAFLPITSARHFCQQLAALPQPGTGGSAERDHRLTGKVVGFYKAVHRPGCYSFASFSRSKISPPALY